LYDELATDLRDGKRYDDLEFTLLESLPPGIIWNDSNVTAETHKVATRLLLDK
jgi:hypothetical protein